MGFSVMSISGGVKDLQLDTASVQSKGLGRLSRLSVINERLCLYIVKKSCKGANWLNKQRRSQGRIDGIRVSSNITWTVNNNRLNFWHDRPQPPC